MSSRALRPPSLPPRSPRVGPELLRAALARGRLPMGALRLTILEVLDAELRRRGRTADQRREHRRRVARYLADHADRRVPPTGAEARRWARRLVRSGRLSRGEADATLAALGFLYVRVLARPAEGLPAPAARRGPSPRPRPAGEPTVDRRAAGRRRRGAGRR